MGSQPKEVEIILMEVCMGWLFGREGRYIYRRGVRKKGREYWMRFVIS